MEKKSPAQQDNGKKTPANRKAGKRIDEKILCILWYNIRVEKRFFRQ